MTTADDDYKPVPSKVCEKCGNPATDYKLDGLADPHYFCPAHASPPRSPEGA